MKEFNRLTLVEIKELNTPDLLEYKKSLWDYGEEMEEYITDLKDDWLYIIKVLKDRVNDLEYDLALIQEQNDDRIYGSADSYPEDNIH